MRAIIAVTAAPQKPEKKKRRSDKKIVYIDERDGRKKIIRAEDENEGKKHATE